MSALDTLTDADLDGLDPDDKLDLVLAIVEDTRNEVRTIRAHVEQVAGLVAAIGPLVESAQGNPAALLAGLMRNARGG